MNDKDMERINRIKDAIDEGSNSHLRGSISPYEGKFLVSFGGHMDEFVSKSDACLWLSALFMKMSVK